MNALDYVVLIGSMLGIALYGVIRTRGRRDLHSYLKGQGNTRWLVIGISVMATQASAITFLSTPGQGYESGLGFVQNYFGAPFALIIISALFLPIYRKLDVYTAYEYLGRRFDSKTRLLGAGLFLLQRGLGAGITIYAPAIVLSTVMGWPLDITIIGSGLIVMIYTVVGGSDAVSHTQKYQLGVIFAGMITAFVILMMKISRTMSIGEAFTVAGTFHRLQAVDFSLSTDRRYTFWSGTLGGLFLALSYFGTDQSQVQRYIGGASLRESRMGLMFNAVCKVPMQFFILLLGVMLFVFYQVNPAPVFFNQPAYTAAEAKDPDHRLTALASDFQSAADRKRISIHEWLVSKRAGLADVAERRDNALKVHEQSESIRQQATRRLVAVSPGTQATDADYVFVTFILQNLPHGVIGMLIAAFFAATLSSKSAELNALASTTTIDIYRHVVKRAANDHHYVTASRCFTVMWGLVAIGFALFAHLVENLIQAVNIVGSIFYGVVLGMFLVAFFIKRVHGTAIFWAAIGAQALVFALYYSLSISYLWYNFIGCAACVIFSVALQSLSGFSDKSST